MDNSFYTSILLISINREGRIYAAFVDYSEYGGYIWLADVDANKLQLNRFPSISSYLQHYGHNLELKYLGDEMISAETTYMKREGGYKEPFQRYVKYSYNGCGCINKLENDLSLQLQSKYQKDANFKKVLFQKIKKSKKDEQK